MAESPHASLLSAIAGIVGPRGMLTDPSDTAPYVTDWREMYRGRTAAVVRPANTEEVAAVIRLCAEARIGVVPQGGNTNMVGGAVPAEDGSQIVLSLSRMNRIRDIDPVDQTMTVDAGVTLKAGQDAAAEKGCLLPLSIGSEGTAQIGGVLATNAGGNNTVRYGNARDLVLGLEVVTPQGEIWNGLRRLRKDNTGYCLRQIFVGSEGTLGVITGAVLRLQPAPAQTEIAFCAVASPAAALSLLGRVRAACGGTLNAFEYMSGLGIDFVLRRIPGASLPIGQRADHYTLIELAAAAADSGMREALEGALADALEAGEVLDAALAESDAQRAGLWRLREEHSEAQRLEGASIKNDISVPVSAVPALLEDAADACRKLIPGARVVAFGHMGDGNIHFNVAQPVDMDGAAFLARDHDVMDTVNAVVRRLGGSFSAEHGVGRLKPYMMAEWRGGVELELMQRIKAAIDPDGIMNPGKVLP